MEDLSMHILDVAQNAIEAGASTVQIDILDDPQADRLVIEVRDDGRGMSEERAKAALTPFFTTRTTRKVGMGLALLAQAARAAGGALELKSRPGLGTKVKAVFQHGHLDRQPLGNVEATLIGLMAGNPNVEIVFRHAVPGRVLSLSSGWARAAIAGRPLASAEGLALLRHMIRSGGRLTSTEAAQ